MIAKHYEFFNPVKVISGDKSVDSIGFELEMLGCKRPIVLTVKDLIDFKVATKVIDSLSCGVDIPLIYDKIPVDSDVEVVQQIAKLFKEHNCDGIVAIGGGSVLDTAKGVKLLISQNKEKLLELAGTQCVKRGIKVPFVAVPTTSGTGSEVTAVAVIKDNERKVKLEFLTSEFMPDIAIIEPKLMLTLPKKLTASTAMDALCHAIESFSCLQKNPMSDSYAISAIKLISNNILKAVENPQDIDARLALANGSLFAGVAFSNSMVGLVHAIGHSLGAICGVAHGDSMAILLPYVMKFNLKNEDCRRCYAEILLYFTNAKVFADSNECVRAEKTIEHISKLLLQLNEKIGFATKLSELKDKKGMPIVTVEKLQQVANGASNDPALIINPIKATTQEILQILQNAM